MAGALVASARGSFDLVLVGSRLHPSPVTEPDSASRGLSDPHFDLSPAIFQHPFVVGVTLPDVFCR
jgi:hypothetical protein